MTWPIPIEQVADYLGTERLGEGRYAPGGTAYQAIDRFRLSIIDQVEKWAPAPEGAADAELERLSRARAEAGFRLVGYTVQRLGALYGPDIGLEGSLPGMGASAFLHSGAAAVLSEWHPLDVGHI